MNDKMFDSISMLRARIALDPEPVESLIGMVERTRKQLEERFRINDPMPGDFDLGLTKKHRKRRF